MYCRYIIYLLVIHPIEIHTFLGWGFIGKVNFRVKGNSFESV